MIDFCNTTDAPVLNNELDLILQQLDMLFDTNHKEVLGELSYGSDFDKFLWDLNTSNYYIQDYIYGTIMRNIELFDYNLTVDVKLMQGTENDIILVIINISKNGKIQYEQKYRIR